MTLVQIIVLALIQGLTEFLPVSSSAHLILGSRLFDWPDQGLVFDVATHVGTLLAVLVYFRQDLLHMVQPWFDRNTGDEASRRLGVIIVISSIPAIVAGGLLHVWVEGALRNIQVIALSTIGFGLLLWWADARFKSDKLITQMNLKFGVMIGFAQMLAFVPGTSRSGVTIIAGRMLGFTVESAARFSFLLSIPVIAAAGGYGVLRMLLFVSPIDWLQFSLGVAFSAVAGWVCIAAFLTLIQRVGIVPFVIYRLALGVVLFWIAF